MIHDVVIKPLNIVPVSGGDVFHALKSSDKEFAGFGEAYFSSVESGAIKAWKRHRYMWLNIVVPIGRIHFVLFDDRCNRETPKFQEVVLSVKNYSRLTIPPMIWFGFQGLSDQRSMLLNIADIPHSSGEVDHRSINKIDYMWENI